VFAVGVFVAQLIGAAPIAAAEPAARPAVAPADGESGQLMPGVHYEDALAHANDRIAFTPGGRVIVPFRPRASDSWQVGGHSPRALPAGTLSGRDLLLAADDKAAPSPDPTAPIDAPAIDPSDAPAADGASATLPSSSGDVSLDGTRLRRQVMGYLPYWEVSAATLDYELLSTIAYFSVGADKNGNLLKTNPNGTPTTGWAGWTSSRLTSIINSAHAKGTRVVLTISVFAWTTGQAALQGALLGSPTARLNLARQAAAAVRARGADGINLDFEPIASGYGDEYAAFVRTVRAELNKQAPGYQLTFDTTGSIGNYPIEAATAPGGADAIFIMGYDYRTAGSGYAGSIDPLSGPAYDLQDTVNAFAARVAPSKLILGVPWYGRAWSTVSDQGNAKTQSGTKYGTSNTVVFDTALDYAKQYGRRWDSREQSPWIAYRRQNCSSTYGCVMTWRQVYYDDAVSIKLRYDMINRMGLRGAGIWALGYDADRIEMRQALAEKFLNDKTIPLAGIRALAPVQRTESFAVSWVGADESGILDYDVQVSIHGGPWHDWLVDTKATSATYAGADGLGFAFRVRARDTPGNLGAWDVSSVYHPHVALAPGGFGKVVASTVNVRSAASTSAPIVTTAGSGTMLAITGGPVSAGGYTWYKATLPIAEWAPIAGVRTDVWVAAGSSSATFVAPVTAPNATGVDLPPGVAPPSGARFAGITPTRFLDTRSGIGLSGTFASGVPRTFPVRGLRGIPSNAVAVTGTLTVVGQSSAGFASIGPSAATVARSSVVNVPAGDVRAAGVSVKLGADGSLAALWTGTRGSRSSLVFDVSGYFVPGASGATFTALTPARVLDTRTGNGLSGLFDSSVARSFLVRGRGGVAAGAVAVTGNLTVVGPSSAGFLYIGPVATSSPPGSSLNVPRGDVRAAAVTVKLDGSGRLGVVWMGMPGAKANVLFDVTGYFVNGGGGATYYPIDSARVLDSRVANGLAGAFASLSARTFQATGRGTIPANAVAVTGGVTVVSPSGNGLVIVGPAGGALGATSTVNIPQGDIRANGLTVRTGPGGGLGIVFNGPRGTKANVLFDATGYFR
jgi:spore germination protein YaaH